MVLTCLFLASKSDGAHFSIEDFVRTVALEKYCTIESKLIIAYMSPLELNTNEIFLIKALKFQLIVHTPFHLVEYMVSRVCPAHYAEPAQLRLKLETTMVKLYQVEHLAFIYTPSHMALACLDLVLHQLPGLTGVEDVTGLFPEVEVSVWDKVGDIKKHLSEFRLISEDENKKIANEILRFHKHHPEFLAKLAELRRV